MALSDLAVFSEFTYTTITEVVAQNIDLFNAASQDTITLKSTKHMGDYSDMITWAKIAGTVRRRNPYGTGAISGVHLTNLIDTMVKVASGTYPIDLSPSMFRWIMMNPADAGVIYGRQLAGDMLQEMVNTAIGALDAALTGYGTTTLDIHAATDNTDTRYPVNTDLLNPIALVGGAQLFGDRAQAIRAWVMHSKPMGDLYSNALLNHERLFSYDTVNVMRDPMGRVYVVSDVPALVKTGTPNLYHTLGLVQGACQVDQNEDFDANESTLNGNENISRTYQAEWSYNLGMKGFQWDKTNGGKAPNNSALFTSSNWDEIATSFKDTAGVLIISK